MHRLLMTVLVGGFIAATANMLPAQAAPVSAVPALAVQTQVEPVGYRDGHYGYGPRYHAYRPRYYGERRWNGERRWRQFSRFGVERHRDYGARIWRYRNHGHHRHYEGRRHYH